MRGRPTGLARAALPLPTRSGAQSGFARTFAHAAEPTCSQWGEFCPPESARLAWPVPLADGRAIAPLRHGRALFEDRPARVLEAVVSKAVMALADRRILTFDVVGTLIDFEAGILGGLGGSVAPAGNALPDLPLLAASARAEDAQQHVSPATPFTQMLNPIYERMASELGLPRGNGEADRLAASIPERPPFPDATDGLARLRARYRPGGPPKRAKLGPRTKSPTA